MVVRACSSLFFLSLAAFLWPLLQEYGEISLLDFTYASAIFLSVMAIQCLVIVLIYIVFSSAYLVKASFTKNPSQNTQKKYFLEFSVYFITALIIAHNVYHFLFTLLSIRQDVETLISISLIPLLFFLMKSKQRLKFTYIFSSVFIALAFVNFSISFFSQSPMNTSSSSSWNLSRFDELNDLKHLEDKRNIYLISFDSVASPESLRRFYNVESAPHLEYLNNTGFKVLDSAFSGGHKTRPSFFNMMSLGEQANLVPAFFSTRDLNPSYVLLGELGYKVQFLFGSNYMGSNTNTLDYFYPEKSFITLCDFIDKAYAYYACNYTILYEVVRRNFDNTGVSTDEFFMKVLDRIRVINKEEESWVTFAHIWYPGHAPLDFVYTDLVAKQQVIDKTLEAYPKLTSMIEQVVNTIFENDDNPIIIFYSDHGAWLTKELDYNQENSMYSAEDIYLEKNGVMFSVYPDSFCKQAFQEGYKIPNLIPDMLKCELNGQ